MAAHHVLFVGNLGSRATTRALRAAFAQRGYPVPAWACEVITSGARGGRMRGFGFVRLPHDEAQRAIADARVGGIVLKERALLVDWAQSAARPRPHKTFSFAAAVHIQACTRGYFARMYRTARVVARTALANARGEWGCAKPV